MSEYKTVKITLSLFIYFKGYIISYFKGDISYFKGDIILKEISYPILKEILYPILKETV